MPASQNTTEHNTDVTMPRTLVLDGMNISLYVAKDDLVISAGYLYGTDIRKIVMSRTGSLPEQIIIRGDSYKLTGDALTWCETAKVVKVSWKGGGRTTDTIQGIRVSTVDTRLGMKERGTTGYPVWRTHTNLEPQKNHPFYRIVQGMCVEGMPLYDTLGLDIHRYLISAKLAGQAQVAEDRFYSSENANEIRKLATKAANGSHKVIGNVERKGAEIYFDETWRDQTLWHKAGQWTCPDHWLTFQGRSSAYGTKNDATNPVTAALNYGYKILQMQTVIAMQRMWLDPELGIDHKLFDERRYAGSMDVMEAARGDADRMILEFLDSHEFGANDFYLHKNYAANPDTGFVGIPGQVSLGRNVKGPICAMAAEMFDAVAPHVENVAEMIHAHSKLKGKRMPRPLTKSNHKKEQARRKKAS